MNEIADFVASETRDRPPADEPKTPTRRCPPMASLTSDEPPDLAADTMAAAQPKASASPPFTPAAAAAESNGVATPASNAAPQQSAAATAEHAAVAATPRSAGSASNSIAVDVSLSPFKSPGTLPAIVGSRPGEGKATLETRMNMYTMALKQHAAGLKIATRERCAIWPALTSRILHVGRLEPGGGWRPSMHGQRRAASHSPEVHVPRANVPKSGVTESEREGGGGVRWPCNERVRVMMWGRGGRGAGVRPVRRCCLSLLIGCLVSQNELPHVAR